jgi:hypothetical protein
MKLKKTLKILSSGQKNPKKTKKTHWAGFFFKKTRVFSNPDPHSKNDGAGTGTNY